MKKNDIDDDMSKTFIAEVGQKSAIADNTEVLEENMIESNFPDIPIQPPKEEMETINNNEINNVEDISYCNERKTKKNNSILVILLMILGLLIGVGGSYYYFEIFNKKETINSKKTTLSKSEKINEEELNADGLFVRNLIADYDFYVINSVDIFNELYLKDKTEISDIDEYYLRNLAAIKSRKILGNSGFSGESFIDAVKTLFGSNFVLENKSFTDSKSGVDSCYDYEYDQKEDYYNFKEPTGCGGATTINLERKIVKAIKKEDSLEIAVAVALVDSSTDRVYKKLDSTITNDSQLVDEVENITAQTFNIDKDYTKVNQYKYKFKYDKYNSNYYLESIELVK